MAAVTFNTQEIIETLERSGLKPEQAKAISMAGRQSHEVADIPTKRDLDDVHKDLSFQISDVRKDLSAEIAGVRKDINYQKCRKASSFRVGI